ncbi:26193_t:CDS:2 [Gigaspora rosea]|nr:26193_t:CDS:2 [Gigaspora rosea]
MESVKKFKDECITSYPFSYSKWDEVSASTIWNCWSHTKILSADTSFHLRIEKFLSISEKNVIYEVPLDDQVITDLDETFRADEPTTVELKDVNNSLEIPIVGAKIANESLETVRTFLLQQNDAEEYVNILRKVEKFIKKVKVTQMQQSKIDRFFTGEN